MKRLARNLKLLDDGTWIAGEPAQVSYPEHGNDLCFAVEDSSFWFQHRNACIVETVKRLPPGGLLCDVGGGNGYVARGLQDAGFDVALLEPGPKGVANARKRGVQQVIRGRVEDLDVRPGAVFGVGLFDVLEHVPDDAAFLREIHGLLAPGGRVYLTVPAYSWLWSHEDIDAGHFRRYSRAALCRVLQDAGFQVEFASYFFTFLPLPILLMRALPFRLGLPKRGSIGSDHRSPRGLVSRLLQASMSRELERIRSGRTCAAGGSCLVVGRRA